MKRIIILLAICIALTTFAIADKEAVQLWGIDLDNMSIQQITQIIEENTRDRRTEEMEIKDLGYQVNVVANYINDEGYNVNVWYYKHYSSNVSQINVVLSGITGSHDQIIEKQNQAITEFLEMIGSPSRIQYYAGYKNRIDLQVSDLENLDFLDLFVGDKTEASLSIYGEKVCGELRFVKANDSDAPMYQLHIYTYFNNVGFQKE